MEPSPWRVGRPALGVNYEPTTLGHFCPGTRNLPTRSCHVCAAMAGVESFRCTPAMACMATPNVPWRPHNGCGPPEAWALGGQTIPGQSSGFGY